MSKYTLQTEEIRGYVMDSYDHSETREELAEKFDTWLAEHDKEVIRNFINEEIEYAKSRKHELWCDCKDGME